MSDDELWALLDETVHPIPHVRDRSEADAPRRAAPRRSEAGADMVAAATIAAARTRSLLTEVRLMLEANQALRAEQRAMLDEGRRVRQEMQMSIQAYAKELRRDGVSPERALLLLKAAMHEGLRAQRDEDAHLADGIVADGVAWGIAAYYAA